MPVHFVIDKRSSSNIFRLNSSTRNSKELGRFMERRVRKQPPV